MTRLEPGQRIAYTARFVRDIGGTSYGIAELRGTLLEHDGRKARVQWDHEEEPSSVLLCNIAPIGSARFADPSYNA